MASERTGVYPGTFDPITSGHMEVMRRSLRLFDSLVIGCAINIGKGPLFSLEERMEIISSARADVPGTRTWEHANENNGEPGWDRTNDHLIKSQMLYR